MSDIVKGVSPDATIVTNENGGRQSTSAYAFQEIDTGAILALAETLKKGFDKYGPGNWRKISSLEHFNHMMAHWYAYRAGDRSDDHLAHMFCRAMMAFATAKTEEEQRRVAEQINLQRLGSLL